MVAISAVRASNANIKATFPNPVAVFLGATSGIGQSTLEQLAKQTDKPTIYLVGRSEKTATAIFENLKKLNPNGTYNFVSCDATLIGSVDKACTEIKAKEKKVDLIVVSCGYLAFSGREETSEGQDALLTIRYYARLRFIQQLLPLHPTRVVSVLAGTTEGVLNEADLSLKDPKNYGIMSCAAHSSTMMSLSFEYLAKQYPLMSFVHAFPGIVKTKALTTFHSAIATFLMKWLVLPLMTPFITSLEEAGERMLFYLTSARYAPLEGPAGVPKPDGVPAAKGQGAYFVSSTGETGEGKPMAGYRERGMERTIWAHTEDVFRQAEEKSK